MSSGLVVLTALGSALAAASSSVLQHRSARRTAAGGHSAMGSAATLLTRPLWLAGLAMAALGLVLHTVALAGGQLAVVQPLLVSGLLFALPLSLVLEGRRPALVEWLWALALIAGLATFLGTARPSAGAVPPGTGVLAACTLIGSVLLVGAVALGYGPAREHKAAMLGTAGGIAFGVTSALLKEVTAIGLSDVGRLLSSWPIYALVAIGAAGIGLTQLAYAAGPLASSLPALTIGDPVAAVVIGAIAFHENLVHTPLAVVLEIVAFAVMFAAAVALARRSVDAPALATA
ncbi:MAG: DMT family transporter [Actinomycetota bacterium]|nr:DMT family transporter [Actinomycetota bacterium]